MFAWSAYNQIDDFGNKDFDKHKKPVHETCLDKRNLGPCIADDTFICSQYTEPGRCKKTRICLAKAYGEMNSGKFGWKCNSYEGMALDTVLKNQVQAGTVSVLTEKPVKFSVMTMNQNLLNFFILFL